FHSGATAPELHRFPHRPPSNQMLPAAAGVPTTPLTPRRRAATTDGYPVGTCEQEIADDTGTVSSGDVRQPGQPGVPRVELVPEAYRIRRAAHVRRTRRYHC
ncbi:hypothetical protein, partial [Nocardia australiensis]|uniref:hypothetical protein n=1 Tax=Nocardia australiensis TaxID=2887191 RepID=UPI001D15D8FB